MKASYHGTIKTYGTMKMRKLFMLAAVAVAAISCTKEITPTGNEPSVGDLIPMTFTTSSDTDTKVAYEGGATVWKVGDKIQVIASTGTATEFTATSVENGGKKATFEGLTENAETYYAVSPANAYVGNDIANGKIYANIPQTQTAVAGTFDPKAFLSVATNSGSELYFKNSCAVVGFKLQNPAGVKSVRFTAAGQTNLAGTGKVETTAIPTHKWDGAYENRSAFDMITLNAPEGGFVANTDYYLTIRPNNCPNGITVLVEYENQAKSRTTTNVLFPNGATNKVRNLGIIDQNLTDLTPYDSYQLGFDIAIGERTINKTTHPNASLINVTEANTDLSSTLKKTGVFFINQNADCSFTITESIAVTKDIIIISNNPEARVNYIHPAADYTWNTGDAVFAMKGIAISITNQYMINNNNGSTDNVRAFIYDDCSITSNNKGLYYGNKKTLGYTLFQFKKCDISTSVDGFNILNLNSTAIMNKNANIKFTDCTFSGIGKIPTFTLVSSGSAAQTDSAPTSTIEVENCTFYNVRPNGSFIKVPWCGNLKFNKNLVGLDKYSNNANIVAFSNDSNNLSTVDASDNYYYTPKPGSYTLKIKSTDSEGVALESDYMFDTTTLTVKSEYAGYGATR